MGWHRDWLTPIEVSLAPVVGRVEHRNLKDAGLLVR